MEKKPLKLEQDEHVKIVITQKTDGTLTLDAGSKAGNVDLYHMVGLIEATKIDILAKTSGDQPMVEITIDELDIELNPDSKMKLGEKIPIPVAANKVRLKARELTMRKPGAEA